MKVCDFIARLANAKIVIFIKLLIVYQQPPGGVVKDIAVDAEDLGFVSLAR